MPTQDYVTKTQEICATESDFSKYITSGYTYTDPSIPYHDTFTSPTYQTFSTPPPANMTWNLTNAADLIKQINELSKETGQLKAEKQFLLKEIEDLKKTIEDRDKEIAKTKRDNVNPIEQMDI